MRSGLPPILVARVGVLSARVLGCWLRSGAPPILVAWALGARVLVVGCWLNFNVNVQLTLSLNLMYLRS